MCIVLKRFCDKYSLSHMESRCNIVGMVAISFSETHSYDLVSEALEIKNNILQSSRVECVETTDCWLEKIVSKRAVDIGQTRTSDMMQTGTALMYQHDYSSTSDTKFERIRLSRRALYIS